MSFIIISTAKKDFKDINHWEEVSFQNMSDVKEFRSDLNYTNRNECSNGDELEMND